MLSAYIAAAMRRATYQLLTDNEGFIGEIPGLQGVLGYAATLEACREDLQSALEEWIVFRLRQGLLVPALDGIDLTAPPVIEEAA